MKIYEIFLNVHRKNSRKEVLLKRSLLILMAAALSVTVFAVSVFAYNPSTDPLVTVSYLNAEKVKIRGEVEASILSKLGFTSFDDLKKAINSGGGSGTSVDTNAIVNQAKTGVLNELGFTSYAKLKEAITTIPATEKNSLNTYIQSSILTQLGLKSMSELKAKLEYSPKLSSSDMDIVVSEVKAEMLKELGYPSFSSLKAAISNSNGGTSSTPADSMNFLIQQLGFSSLEELKDAITKNESNNPPDEPNNPDDIPPVITNSGYQTVTLVRGQTIIALDNCEAILTSGLVGIVGNYINSGVADITAGKIKGYNDLLDTGHSYLIPKPENSYALICVSSEAVIFIRGEYEIV